jgi:hypothetical protein
MDSLLEQLYWGNLQPDTTPLKSRAQLRREAEKQLELSEKFSALLSPAAAEAYEEMSTYQNEIEGNTDARRFAVGFKLGALFMVEIFAGFPEE